MSFDARLTLRSSMNEGLRNPIPIAGKSLTSGEYSEVLSDVFVAVTAKK